MAAAGPAAGELDFLRPLRSAGTLENPYPVYGVIRTVRPVLEVPIPGYDGPGAWLLTRYQDVHQALRDRRFSVERMRAPLVRENLDRLPDFLRRSAQGLRSMLVMDPPDHTRVRKLVNKAFTPRRVKALHHRIEQLVRELADAAERIGRMDLIHDFAEPLPAIVIAELLGVPPEDHRRFRAWSSRLIAAIAARSEAERRATASAGEELLRYDGPVQATVRVALEDVAMGDHVIPEGALVLLSIGAANHDPEVFEAPEQLDLARDPNPHLAFGFATHFCLGAPLARLEAALAFRALCSRFPNLALVSDVPAYRPNPVLRGLQRLEVMLGPEAGS